MRIAHIVSHAALNGVATSCRTLIEAQLAAGHEVFLAVSPGSWLAGALDTDRLTILESGFKTRPGEIARVGYAIRDWGADVVHCHGSRANKYGLVYRFAGRIPVVATAHASLFQLPWRWFHAVIAPSRAAAEFHRSRNLVPAKRIHRIYNMVSRAPAPSEAERAALRTELGLSDRHRVVGMVGALTSGKNQIEALHILRLLASMEDIRLVLVGSVPDGQEPMAGWNELMSDPDVGSRVILTGRRPDATRLMSIFDVCLYVSSNEAGPLAPLESMALGVPLVAYEVGCLPEVIETGVNGALVPQRDRSGAAAWVGRLLCEPDVADELGRLGALTIDRNFAAEVIERQIHGVYSGIVKDGSADRSASLAQSQP